MTKRQFFVVFILPFMFQIGMLWLALSNREPKRQDPPPPSFLISMNGGQMEIVNKGIALSGCHIRVTVVFSGPGDGGGRYKCDRYQKAWPTNEILAINVQRIPKDATIKECQISGSAYAETEPERQWIKVDCVIPGTDIEIRKEQDNPI